MAWNIHWQCCFQSRTGTQYAVNIYERDYIGDVVQLTGAEEPFVTQEEDDNDIFLAIRPQTGYLRVVDTTQDGSLLESIIPTNNTQKLVRLYSGTYANGAFTEGTIQWQGFLCAEAFSQPWDTNIKVIEFPVKSLLGALEDVQMQASLASNEYNVAKLIHLAFDALDVVPSTFVVSSQMDDALNDFLRMILQFIVFYKEETVNNEGDSYKQLVGASYSEALSDICSLYGLTMRESGTTICLSAYDKQGNRIYTNEWSNADIVRIGSGQNPTASSGQFMPETSMLPQLTFRGSNNDAGFVQGGKNAKVTLAISGMMFYLDLPQATESPDAPIELALLDDGDETHEGTLYVQVHSPRYLRENQNYLEYQRRTLIGPSTYEDMLEHSVIEGYVADPYYSENQNNLFTGAFPCRFYHRKENEVVTLKNGIYMNTQYYTSGQSSPITYAAMYSVTSFLSLNATEGWLNIQFLLEHLAWMVEGSYQGYVFGDGINKFCYNYDIDSEVRMCIQVGNLFWNGTDWVEGSVPDTYFWFKVTNGRVPNNKTSDMNTDEENGYFIPVTRPLVGAVTFHILNGMLVKYTTPSYTRYLTCYTHILSELNISHILPKSVVASDRSHNVYRKAIISSGFSEDKEKELNVGTINNNYFAPSFIKLNTTDYAESVGYYTSDGTTDVRPEMHLLDRMVAQYGQVRRTFKGIVATGLELLKTRYTYLSRAFFGIDAKHNWRDEEQQVKFIEVS